MWVWEKLSQGSTDRNFSTRNCPPLEVFARFPRAARIFGRSFRFRKLKCKSSCERAAIACIANDLATIMQRNLNESNFLMRHSRYPQIISRVRWSVFLFPTKNFRYFFLIDQRHDVSIRKARADRWKVESIDRMLLLKKQRPTWMTRIIRYLGVFFWVNLFKLFSSA